MREENRQILVKLANIDIQSRSIFCHGIVNAKLSLAYGLKSKKSGIPVYRSQPGPRQIPY